MSERPDIGFLDHVLGFAVVAQDSAGEPVKPAVVRLHDGTNGHLIAVADALDQFGIRGPGGRDFMCSLRWLAVAPAGSARSANTLPLPGWMQQRPPGSV